MYGHAFHHGSEVFVIKAARFERRVANCLA